MVGTKRRCHHCREYKPVEETALMPRTVGGSYRRAPTSQDCGICLPCARDLVAAAQPKQYSIAQWNVFSLRRWVESQETKP